MTRAPPGSVEGVLVLVLAQVWAGVPWGHAQGITCQAPRPVCVSGSFLRNLGLQPSHSPEQAGPGGREGCVLWQSRRGPACTGGGGGACRAGLEPQPNDISCARSTSGKEGGCFWRRAAGGQAPRVCPHQALGSKGGTPCLGPWLCLSGDSSRKEEWPHLGVEQSPRRGPALPALCGPGQACPCVQVCDRRGQSRSAGHTASLGCLTRGGQSPRPCWEGGEGDS